MYSSCLFVVDQLQKEMGNFFVQWLCTLRILRFENAADLECAMSVEKFSKLLLECGLICLGFCFKGVISVIILNCKQKCLWGNMTDDYANKMEMSFV